MKLSLAIFVAVVLMPMSAGSAITRPATLLKARPIATAAGLPAGETRLAGDAIAYRPASVPARPLALLVLLHGAGGYPPNFLQAMEPLADRLGLILFAPHSRGPTWDLVENMAIGEDPWSGGDARQIDLALGELFGRACVDPSHIVLLGFSDGASYALSLGAANPKLFTAVIALSPGMIAPIARVDRAQRIFIAHGSRDHVLPFAATADIAAALRSQGADVRLRPFDGDHQIDAAALSEGLEWALDLTPSGSDLQHQTRPPT